MRAYQAPPAQLPAEPPFLQRVLQATSARTLLVGYPHQDQRFLNTVHDAASLDNTHEQVIVLEVSKRTIATDPNDKRFPEYNARMRDHVAPLEEPDDRVVLGWHRLQAEYLFGSLLELCLPSPQEVHFRVASRKPHCASNRFGALKSSLSMRAMYSQRQSAIPALSAVAKPPCLAPRSTSKVDSHRPGTLGCRCDDVFLIHRLLVHQEPAQFALEEVFDPNNSQWRDGGSRNSPRGRLTSEHLEAPGAMRQQPGHDPVWPGDESSALERVLNSGNASSNSRLHPVTQHVPVFSSATPVGTVRTHHRESSVDRAAMR